MIYIDDIPWIESDNDVYRSAVINALEQRPSRISEFNTGFFGLKSSSRLLSLYSPDSIAFTEMAVFPSMLADCDLHIKTSAKNYVKTMNTIKPTHTLMFPCIYNRIEVDDIDFSECEQLLVGTDLTPMTSLAFLRMAGAKEVYSVYGSTQTPPIVAFTEADNHYRWDNVTPSADIKIVDNQLHVKWDHQQDWWVSDDVIRETTTGFEIVEKRYQCV